MATPVTVDGEPTTRTLIVSGPTSVFAAVEEVLQQVDGPANGPGTSVKMYALKHARAERLQTLLNICSRRRRPGDPDTERAAGART